MRLVLPLALLVALLGCSLCGDEPERASRLVLAGLEEATPEEEALSASPLDSWGFLLCPSGRPLPSMRYSAKNTGFPSPIFRPPIA